MIWHRDIRDGIRKRLGVNRITRMQLHYLAIKDEVRCKGAKEQQELQYFSEKFEAYLKRTRSLAKLRFLLYLLLYASVTVNLLKTIPFLSFLVAFVEFGSAILGTTVLLALVFWVTMKINVHLELMNECLTHLIALYHKNPRRDTMKVLRDINRTL